MDMDIYIYVYVYVCIYIYIYIYIYKNRYIHERKTFMGLRHPVTNNCTEKEYTHTIDAIHGQKRALCSCRRCKKALYL